MLDTETPEEKVRRIHEMIANLAHYMEDAGGWEPDAFF
jgi:hypothetical protein